MVLPGRSGNAGDYRYGYNGMEQDQEIKGDGNSYTTYYRQYDPRIARWTTTDPDFSSPWQSPYCSMNNNPILMNDPKGDKARIRMSRKMRKELGLTRKEARNYTPEQLQTTFREEYGMEVEVQDGWLVYTGESEIQPQTVSQSAKNMWIEQLSSNNESKMKFKLYNGTKRVMEGQAGGWTLHIDLGDFNEDGSMKHFNYDNVPVRAWNLARVMEHEGLGHVVKNLLDEYWDDNDDPATRPGPCVELINTFRREMGLPIRAAYGKPYKDKKGKHLYIPFEYEDGTKGSAHIHVYNEEKKKKKKKK